MKTKTKKSGTVHHDKTALEQSDDHMSSVVSIISAIVSLLMNIGGLPEVPDYEEYFFLMHLL
ncbi:MAG: hypothetical protein ACOX36_01505 [Saccharofermentanales bacterium]|jgi:hypothetical protein|nr:hypothetical protein [Clostridiaceae bacterium]